MTIIQKTSELMSMTAKEFYAFSSYKKLIKSRVMELRKNNPGITLGRLAEKIAVQPTFLSRVLNEKKAQLNEDHLFRIGKFLKLTADEIDFLMLLRAHEVTLDLERRELLRATIERLRKQAVLLEVESVAPEQTLQWAAVFYMVNPYAQLVHMALFVERFQREPRRLMRELNLTEGVLRETLLALKDLGYIQVGKDLFDIVEVEVVRNHFGPEHSLTRMHQQIVKSYLLNQLANQPEAQKESFFVTFVGDERTFERVKKKFRDFLATVEQDSLEDGFEQVFQMSFDFIKVV